MYQYLDAAVVRAAAWRPGREMGPWPDLSGQAASPASWRPWLRQTMQIPDFAAALEQASPVLACRVREICSDREVPGPTVRRAVLSVMRYLLRASGRATPFGLFAGVAPARITPLPATRVGRTHRAIAKVEAGWLTTVIERLEAEPALLPRLKVLANNMAFERDGHLVLEHRSNGSYGGAPTHVRVRATRPVRAAVRLTCDPILLGDLAEKLAADFPGVPADVIDALLADMVAQRLLVTNLRPAMTVSDPLGYLVGELQAVAAGEVAEVAGTVKGLRDIAHGLFQHNIAPASAIAAEHRARLASAMAIICPTPGPELAVDLRMDWHLAVPHAVAAEAAKAAGVLVRLAPRQNLSPGWVAWHGRFLERYGPRALVPVLDAVDADIGLGYPVGYLGGASTPPGGALTDRDVKLLMLAQKAALLRQREILLDEAMVANLAAFAPEAHIQPTTELTVRVHASSTRSLGQGEFTLAIVGVSRAAGTTTGRFLDLFDDKDRERMCALYANLPTVNRNALTVQISAFTPYTNTENVARAPQVMEHLLPLGEYHDDGVEGRIALEDIAVTADAHRICLVSRSRCRPVEPVMLNAVELVNHTHPLVRFLVEATSALSVPCASFDWGVAASLPFLPALRYGRTILSPARWLLTSADLPGPTARWPEWDSALAAWQEQVALPRRIYLGEGDQRIGLDLSEPAHRALLRARVERAGTALLRAAPEADAVGWIGGHVHEIVVPLVATGRRANPPLWPEEGGTVGRDHGHLPGCDGRFSLKLYGHPDRQNAILTRHLPHLISELGDQAQWWFLRYHDPDEHVRLRLTVPADSFAPTAARIATWSQSLRRTGLIARVQWDTYFPETARFGGSAAMDTAESYFAADSAAALAQLTASGEKNGPDIRALTAASLLDITIALIGDAAEAMSWLIEHTRAQSPAPARALYDQALALANPNDQRALTAQPGGGHVVSCWARRRKALAAYRTVLEETGTTRATLLLPDLLHLHHVRMSGTDLQDERACLHLARAAALSWAARAKGGS
ncbi:lantibiotic dehydratase [Sphaerisporangium sp. NPDC051017]|uniref:lantibiotic dehydratase n=1 Tax=Sphaerisporangium sp. NPDC051017 TaxID=3154636 RepID=UPI0034358B19